MALDDKLMENHLLELKRGTLTLAVLLRSGSPVYGYALVVDLKSAGIDIEQNTLYPLLRRLEQQGLLESSWNTEQARPRKYYQITAAGGSAMAILAQEWRRLNGVISKLLDSEDTR